MEHPHILFVYKQFPATSVGHAGGESLYRLMEGLHSRGFKISLVAKIAEEEKKHLPAVQELCEYVITTPHFRSMSGSRLLTIPGSYLALRRKTRQAIKEIKPDLLHVETTQTAVTLLGMRRPPASYRPQDINWFLYEQRIHRSTGLRKLIMHTLRIGFRWLETAVCQSYEIILAISRGDQKLLDPVCAEKPVLLVPLGTPMPEDQPQEKTQSPPKLLFVGDMSRKLNVQGILWFLDGIWPTILTEVPSAQLYVVGRNPPPELKTRSDDSQVHITGFVDDLSPWYRKATVFISPLLVAGGLLQKVLDAMWLGIPVVATSVCNHGLGAAPGKEIVTADTEATFANAVVELLDDPSGTEELGLRGQTFVKTHYDIEPALDRWSESLINLCNKS